MLMTLRCRTSSGLMLQLVSSRLIVKTTKPSNFLSLLVTPSLVLSHLEGFVVFTIETSACGLGYYNKTTQPSKWLRTIT